MMDYHEFGGVGERAFFHPPPDKWVECDEDKIEATAKPWLASGWRCVSMHHLEDRRVRLRFQRVQSKQSENPKPLPAATAKVRNLFRK